MMARLVVAAIVMTSGVVWAADAGIAARKMVLLDKSALFKVKLVWVAKNDPGIAKGPAGELTDLSGSFEWFYETDGASSVFGCFGLPNDRWIANSDNVAKFVNPSFEGGGIKKAVVKPAKVAKVTSQFFGESGGGSLFDGPPTADEGLTVVLTIENAADSSTHRMCSTFATDSGSTVVLKEVAGGLGRKLLLKNAVPTPTPCPPTPCS